jgi:hypothetical protein
VTRAMAAVCASPDPKDVGKAIGMARQRNSRRGRVAPPLGRSRRFTLCLPQQWRADVDRAGGLRGRVEKGKAGGGLCYGYDVVKRTDSEGEPVRGERRINEAGP